MIGISIVVVFHLLIVLIGMGILSRMLPPQ
jgi:hypothetical protein